MERVMRWRLILEEYNPELIYTQGSENISTDLTSRLDIVYINNPIKSNILSLVEHFYKEDVLHQINYKLLCDINKTMNLYLQLLNQTKTIR